MRSRSPTLSCLLSRTPGMPTDFGNITIAATTGPATQAAPLLPIPVASTEPAPPCCISRHAQAVQLMMGTLKSVMLLPMDIHSK